MYQQPPNNEPRPQTGAWEPQPETSYEQGYRPMPQPPMQPWYPPQYPPQYPYPPQPYPMQSPPPYYQQPYLYPQQQMMYPPQQVMMVNNTYTMRTQQVNGLVRVLYFLFIGWWLGLLWLSIALTLLCTIIGIPAAMIMFHMLPAILTLQRH